MNILNDIFIVAWPITSLFCIAWIIFTPKALLSYILFKETYDLNDKATTAVIYVWFITSLTGLGIYFL